MTGGRVSRAAVSFVAAGLMVFTAIPGTAASDNSKERLAQAIAPRRAEESQLPAEGPKAQPGKEMIRMVRSPASDPPSEPTGGRMPGVGKHWRHRPDKLMRIPQEGVALSPSSCIKMPA